MDKKDYYKILKISKSASLEEVKSAYRLLARKYHPDVISKEDSDVDFQDIAEAYSVLSHPVKRAEYDRSFSITATSGIDPLSAYRKAQENKNQPKHDSTSTAFKNFKTVNKQKEVNSENLTNKLKNIYNNISSRIGVFSKDNKIEKTTDSIRGDRVFYFSITVLESIYGAVREVAIRSADNKIIQATVRIPPIYDLNEIVTLPSYSKSNPDEEIKPIKAKIQILEDEHLSRKGLDLFLKVPITFGECISGTSLELNSASGKFLVKIPPQKEKITKLRIKNKGVYNDIKREQGDLFIIPVITPPNRFSNQAMQATSIIDQCYDLDIREEIKKLVL